MEQWDQIHLQCNEQSSQEISIGLSMVVLTYRCSLDDRAGSRFHEDVAS